jgi:16S rRNA C967 or C1407 C5-methylase (RsmB/RsmF family)
MSETTQVQVEFDERRYAALVREAERLGIDVSKVVYRATAAWLTEMADESARSPFGEVLADETAGA